MVLGQVISQLRKQRGLTQAQLASALGISQAAVSKMEGGTPPNVFVHGQVAAALGVDVPTLDRLVREALARTRAAASAASGQTTPTANWAQLLLAAGFIGLVIFAVAKVLDEALDSGKN